MVRAVVNSHCFPSLMALVLLTTKQCSPRGMPSFKINLQLGVVCKAVKWLMNPTGFVMTLYRLVGFCCSWPCDAAGGPSAAPGARSKRTTRFENMAAVSACKPAKNPWTSPNELNQGPLAGSSVSAGQSPTEKSPCPAPKPRKTQTPSLHVSSGNERFSY